VQNTVINLINLSISQKLKYILKRKTSKYTLLYIRGSRLLDFFDWQKNSKTKVEKPKNSFRKNYKSLKISFLCLTFDRSKLQRSNAPFWNQCKISDFWNPYPIWRKFFLTIFNDFLILLGPINSFPQRTRTKEVDWTMNICELNTEYQTPFLICNNCIPSWKTGGASILLESYILYITYWWLITYSMINPSKKCGNKYARKSANGIRHSAYSWASWFLIKVIFSEKTVIFWKPGALDVNHREQREHAKGIYV
jgi:hypothetical protein